MDNGATGVNGVSAQKVAKVAHRSESEIALSQSLVKTAVIVREATQTNKAVTLMIVQVTVHLHCTRISIIISHRHK